MHYTVCTALLRCEGTTSTASLIQRLKLLESILAGMQPADVLLLPGGFFTFRKAPEEVYAWLNRYLPPLIALHRPRLTVVSGVDSSEGGRSHELAVAVSRRSILAGARKFHADPSLVAAAGPWEREYGLQRTFTRNGRRYYLAVCYDSFGLRQNRVRAERPVNVVLNTIHYFMPAGKPQGGDVYFARHGMAGSARHWKCPVFGAAHFLRPAIPVNWPSGVRWKRSLPAGHVWTYADNTLRPRRREEVAVGSEMAELRYYRL